MMYRIVDSRNSEWSGALAGVGDVDGDGLGDLLVGDRTSNDIAWRAGVAYLLSGASIELADRADGLRDGVIDIRRIGGLPDSYQLDGSRGSLTGAGFVGIGDVDGDGLAEIIVISPDVTGAGKIHLISPVELAAADAADGEADGVLSVHAATGLGASYRFTGTTAGAARDLDGDGRADLLFGRTDAHLIDPDLAGLIHYVPAAGMAGADAQDGTVDGGVVSDEVLAHGGYKFISRARGDGFGSAASGIGDIDGDGVGDLMLVGPGGGGTWALPRADGKVVLVTSARLEGADAADGARDGVIEIPNIAGQAGAYTLHSNAPGLSAVHVGDVDGDGLGDVLIAADWIDAENPPRTRVHLATAASLADADAADGVVDGNILLGNLDVAHGAYHFTSNQAGVARGVSVASAGDVDGDGRGDLLLGVGTGELGPGRLDAGVVHLLLAADLAALDASDGTADGRIRLDASIGIGGSYHFVGAEAGAGANVGFSVDDLDGDGRPDLAVKSNQGYHLISASDLDVADALDGKVDHVIDLGEFGIPNTPPVAVDDGGAGFRSAADAPTTLPSVLDNDVDEDRLRVTSVDVDATLGTVSHQGNGVFVYDPAGAFDALRPGETATDCFSYAIADGRGGTAEASVTIVVEGVNDAPAFAGGDLVFHNGFDDADALVRSAVGPDPTVAGSPVAFAPSKHGDGFMRVADDSRVTLPDALFADLGRAGAVEMWITPQVAGPAAGQVFDLLGGAADLVHLGWSAGGGLTAELRFGADGAVGASAREGRSFAATPGESHHVAVVWDVDGIDGTADTLRAYRDGEIVAASTQTWDRDGAYDGGADGVQLGGDVLGAWITDDLMVWDEAKTNFQDRGSPGSTWAPRTFWVEENAVEGTVVGVLRAADPEGDALVHALSGGVDVDGDGLAPFAIDALTGEISVADAGDLDHEAIEAFSLQATATDPGGLGDAIDVTIRLRDVAEAGNDRPVVEDGAASIPTGAPAGATVFTMALADADPGDVHAWEIVSGNGDFDGDGIQALAIDSSGTVVVGDADDIGFWVHRNFALEVRATDAGGLSDTAALDVTVAYMFERFGTNGPDVLVGSDRRDLIVGRAGDDVLQGGLLSDVLRGGDGVDTVRESAWRKMTLSDGLLVGKGEDLLEGIERAWLTGSGVGDVIDASAFTGGAVRLEGRGGPDTLIAPSTAGLSVGWSGHANVLVGGEADDTFVGGAGRDMIEERYAARYIVGDGEMIGAGRDVFSGIEAVSLVASNSGSLLDVSGFRGERTFLTVRGRADEAIGGAALDTLFVADFRGDCVLTDEAVTSLVGDPHALSGVDAVRLRGENRAERFDVTGSTARTIEMQGQGGDDVFVGSDRRAEWVREKADVDFTLTATQLIGLGTDTLNGIDYVRLIGGASANTFDVSAFDGIRTFIHPEGGDDTVIGRAGGLDRVVVYADVDMVLSDDQLLGQGTVTLRDVDEAAIFALGGDVTFDASAFTRGPVKLVGGAGDDVLIGGRSSDELTGGAGDDQLFGGKGWDMVVQQGDVDMALTDATLTGVGVDTLDSIERAHLTGGLGDNTLDASAFTGRIAILEGGWGDDRLIGRAGGIDVVMAQGDVDFTLTDASLTGLGTDALSDIDQARLYGWSGSNTFDASAFARGPVRIYAGAGDDVLVGGAGADLLDGGEGADAYWLLDPAFGADELLFVPGEDTLHLAAAGFAELPAGALAPSRFIDDGGAPATGDAVLLYDAATGALSYDADGDGAGEPVLIATLRDAPALSASDIFVEALLV